MKKPQDLDAFRKAWEEYPTQDNEGFVPDRGGFKCGWFAALAYQEAENEKLRKDRDKYKLRAQQLGDAHTAVVLGDSSAIARLTQERDALRAQVGKGMGSNIAQEDIALDIQLRATRRGLTQANFARSRLREALEFYANELCPADDPSDKRAVEALALDSQTPNATAEVLKEVEAALETAKRREYESSGGSEEHHLYLEALSKLKLLGAGGGT